MMCLWGKNALAPKFVSLEKKTKKLSMHNDQKGTRTKKNRLCSCLKVNRG